jgi:hypothetical protein
MSTEIDLIELLERDHRRIDGLAESLDTTSDTEEVRALFVQVLDAVLVHERIEREILFPAFLQVMADDEGATIQARTGEHEELDELLEEMCRLDVDGYAFIKRGSALLLELEGHFAREEESVFAPMRAKVPAAELVRLGRRALSVESTSDA